MANSSAVVVDVPLGVCEQDIFQSVLFALQGMDDFVAVVRVRAAVVIIARVVAIFAVADTVVLVDVRVAGGR